MLKFKPLGRTGVVGAVFIIALFLGIVGWGLVRKVPVVLNVEPKTALLTIDRLAVQNGDRIGFGKKSIQLEAAGYVPHQITKNLRLFSTLRLEFKLRPLPQAQKITAGDYLRQDRKGKIFYRSSGKIFREIPVTEEKFSSLADIVFSPDGLLAWVKFQDGLNGIYDFKRYDITSQEFHRFDDGIVAAVWLPSSTVTQPEKQRLVYLQNGVLFKTDPLKTSTERLIDLSSQGISQAALEWSDNEKVLMIVANQNLYFLEPQTKTLSKVAQDGVSSAKIAPDSHAVVFTKNGELTYQKFSLVNPFSTKPEDQQNIGKVLVEPAVALNLQAQAKDGAFSKDGRFVIAPGGRVIAIDLSTGQQTTFHHQNLPGTPVNIKLSDNNAILFETAGVIYSLTLDDGAY